jgi:hypothetical protein
MDDVEEVQTGQERKSLSLPAWIEKTGSMEHLSANLVSLAQIGGSSDDPIW